MRYLLFTILLALGVSCEEKPDPKYDGCAQAKLIAIWCDNDGSGWGYGIAQILTDPGFGETWTYNDKEYPNAVRVIQSADLFKKHSGWAGTLSSLDSTFYFNYKLNWGESIWPACEPFAIFPEKKILVTTILSKPCL